MASPQLALFGFALILAFLAMFWIAGHLRPGALRTDGSRIEDPWFSPSWSASTGSGNGNGADDPQRPSVVTIKHLADRRTTILRWLRKMGVPESEVEDVAQNIIQSAWRTSPGYDPTRAKLDTWLHRITFHHAEGFHKSAYAQHSVPFNPHEGPWQHLHADGNPEAAAAESEARDQILDILDRLPVHQAVAVFISDYHGEDTPEIAKAWGKNKSTVYSWISQGRAAIEKELRRDALEDELKKKRDPEDEEPS